MKKKILIGCGIFVLLSFIWIGAGNINAAAKTDGSSDNVAAVVKDSGIAKKIAAASIASNLNTELSSSKSERQKTSAASEEGLLYTINTSAGSNLGMVPIVGGNAVVIMDGSYSTVYEGNYTPEEQSAFSFKVEEETAQAASAGKIEAWAFYREAMLHDFSFPDGVSDIEKFAFARSGLNSVSIPEGVTRIGYGAFYHCDTLSDVTIPDSVTVIEEHAFSHTPWLENWMAAGGEASEETNMTEVSETSNTGDFLIVGDGILLAYRGSEAKPELPAEVKSVVPGVFGE